METDQPRIPGEFEHHDQRNTAAHTQGPPTTQAASWRNTSQNTERAESFRHVRSSTNLLGQSPCAHGVPRSV